MSWAAHQFEIYAVQAHLPKKMRGKVSFWGIFLGDAPGDATTLTFELSMHPGMDGPHDLGLHVPVDDGTDSQQLLTLDVTGDFRS